MNLEQKAKSMYPRKDFEQFKPDLIRQGLDPNATYFDWLKFERKFANTDNPDAEDIENQMILDYKIRELSK